MKLTIGIKAFNEEQHIAASLASAVEAARALDGEVVLADSCSTDRTVEIAKTFPVRIVQLADPTDRSCGAGAQLAFQHAAGELFYLLDGDMVLDPEFLPAAIDFLERNPDVAAVGGRVEELNIHGHEFQIRADSLLKDPNRIPGIVDRLDGGGLYRASAVRDAGYLADRNLHAFEEFELAARLQSKGWKLARIDRHAVDHYGYKMDGYELLWHRAKLGYSGAAGEILRAAIGGSHLSFVVRKLGHIRNGAAVILWWIVLLASIATPMPLSARVLLLLVLVAGPIAVLSFRRRSLSLGLYSFVAWNVVALGMLTGLFRKRVSPAQPLSSLKLETHAGPNVSPIT